MAVSRLTIIKTLELTLAAICLGIHHESFIAGPLDLAIITTGTFVAYIIILVGVIVAYLLQAPLNHRISIYFSLVGCALFIAAGAMLIDTFHRQSKSDWRDKQLAKGSMAIINGAVFLIDAALTFNGERQ